MYAVYLKEKNWQMLYAGAYGNIGGYVIGLITGYCFYKSRGKKLFRSKVCSLIFSLDQEL